MQSVKIPSITNENIIFRTHLPFFGENAKDLRMPENKNYMKQSESVLKTVRCHVNVVHCCDHMIP